MLHPIMEAKRLSAKRTMVVPPASAATALRLPSPEDIPPPYADIRLVLPETREEMLDGRLIEAFPANTEHGDEHTELDRVMGTHAARDRTPSTDLLTRADEGSDFATDLCIRRSGIDPRTGSRFVEELAFEVVNEQSKSHITTRARKLRRCGVRRIFAIFVKKREVCEWSPAEDRFISLDLDGTIEDRALVCPVPVRALFDTAVADDSLVDALEAKGNSRLAQKVTNGRKKGLEEGRKAGLRRAVETVCTVLDLRLGPAQRKTMATLDPNALESLLAHLETHRRWPTA